ncbi:hypothetical protein LSCM1_00248 [Leishmania martiniquensis]|uniref:Uncharacterized protein n=1 Tax=Leishmania martiniquensis TaxID=1580590 RepID=A0A836GTX2_9TRYP|nr:hypothetical protein LSCM1_00248 [Leishmania martiniquensis]
MSHHTEDDSVSAPAVHPPPAEPLAGHPSPTHVGKRILGIDSKDESFSHGMNESPVLAPQPRHQLADVPITVTTTMPSSSLRASLRRGCDAVYVNPQRSATVAAAASARQKAEDEASVRPLTAEDESWGHWGLRYLYNGLVMMIMSLYSMAQHGVKQQPVDTKALECVNDIYMPAPPRAADLKEAGQTVAAERSFP